MKYFLFFCLGIYWIPVRCQQPDYIYYPAIHSVKFYKTGDPLSYPVIQLNSRETLELNFDDLDGDVKNYYYTYQLCNADWSVSNLRPFDYIQGFQQVRITTYRPSSIALTRYTNYQAVLPDRNCIPVRSGNYLLKVFRDGDTSKLVFTKRFFVVDRKVSLSAQVMQPFNGNLFKTHQKLQVAVSVDPRVNVFSQQELKVVLLQNYSWVTAVYLSRPTIIRGNYFEYNDESLTTFAAGKEWRWIDLRSLRLMSERMIRMEKQATRTDVYVKPDGERQQQVYLYYRDLNGLYSIETSDNINPFWQSDYAYVHFSYFPPGNKPYPEKDLFLFGELTGYRLNDSAKMNFNEERGAYEKTLLLKQGFYNYTYVARPVKKGDVPFSFEYTEGNYWGTENAYQVLVYYRSFGGRHDELIGFSTLNSVFQRP
jgi:hypothetical protein